MYRSATGRSPQTGPELCGASDLQEEITNLVQWCQVSQKDSDSVQKTMNTSKLASFLCSRCRLLCLSLLSFCY